MPGTEKAARTDRVNDQRPPKKTSRSLARRVAIQSNARSCQADTFSVRLIAFNPSGGIEAPVETVDELRQAMAMGRNKKLTWEYECDSCGLMGFVPFEMADVPPVGWCTVPRGKDEPRYLCAACWRIESGKERLEK